MTQGSDVLDALVTGVNILELDPTEDSVGYGGLPNAEGVVQLDSCCMHGPASRPAEWPRSKGSAPPRSSPRRFWSRPITPAGRQGGTGIRPQTWGGKDRGRPEHRALAPAVARMETPHRSDHYLDPKQRSEAGFQAALQMASEGLLRREHLWARSTATG